MSSTGNHFGVTGNILGCDTRIVFALTLAMKVITSKMRLYMLIDAVKEVHSREINKLERTGSTWKVQDPSGCNS